MSYFLERLKKMNEVVSFQLTEEESNLLHNYCKKNNTTPKKVLLMFLGIEEYLDKRNSDILNNSEDDIDYLTDFEHYNR